MSDPFIGEIRLFSMGWAPKGWLPCQGQILQISQNQALYALLNIQYGGDGKTTFALPDLRGRVGVGQGRLYVNGAATGSVYIEGKTGGAENVTLTTTNLPPHIHSIVASNTNGTTTSGAGSYLAKPVESATSPDPQNLYVAPGSQVALNPATIGNAGGGGAHDNMQPFQVLNYCICVSGGVFPPRN